MAKAKIVVDGREYEVESGVNLLETCLTLGIDLPYFCWHPALGSVGACRQCAIKQFEDEDDTEGKLVMACMTPAEDGARVAVEDEEAREFRAAVIEWMMRNHPHDCPVCDEGGECHLQDMTVMTGHVHRRYPFPKRTFENQDLGPFVTHEMNRCITCYRCVRFYRDHAGGTDLDSFGVHDRVYFGRRGDGKLESEFSGNLVEVCPTGVFTDRPLERQYVRKWDMQSTPSVCSHCGLGCNTLVGQRGGRLLRVRNRYHDAVNGYFLCDRGRYGYGSADLGADGRLHTPLRRSEDRVEPIGADDAAGVLRDALGAGSVLGIGSPRSDLESLWALRRAVGKEAFFAGVSDREWRLTREVLAAIAARADRVASIGDAEQAECVLVLGEPVSDTAPRLALALRQAARLAPMHSMDDLGIPRWRDRIAREVAQGTTGPCFVVTPSATRIDDVGEAIRRDPASIARLGRRIAAVLRGDGADREEGGDADERALAKRIAEALGNGTRPVIVSGTGAGSIEIVRAAAAIVDALDSASVAWVVPECDSLGLAMLADAGGLEAAARSAANDAPETLVVLEGDLGRRMSDGRFADLLDAAQRVIVLDARANPTTEHADLVLPIATFAERTGTLVNHEGRAQRSFRVVPPHEPIVPGWTWLSRAGADVPGSLVELLEAMAEDEPRLRPLVDLTPLGHALPDGFRVPRAPFRFSGRTSMHAAETLHEPRPPDDPDAPLAFSMEGRTDRMPPSLITFYHAPGWNSVQALNRYQTEVGGALKGGSPGRRLFSVTDGEPRVEVPAEIEAGMRTPEIPVDGFVAVPLFHVFGSEATSALAPPIRGLVPSPYVAMRADDARGVEPGSDVEFEIDGRAVRLPLAIRDDLAPGTIGLPVGLPRMPFVELPAVARRRT